MEDASATRLREATLAYVAEGAWVRRVLGLRAAEVAVGGRNLATWTRYTGYDPEGSVAGAAAPVHGIDWFGAPPERALVLSVTLTR